MSGSPSQSSVAGELSQLGVTLVELPELRTQLNSGGKSCKLQQSTTVRLLPHLVRHAITVLVWSHTKPNNSVSEIQDDASALMESFMFTFHDNLQHHDRDRINTVFPHSPGCLTCAIFDFDECLTR